jgi:hypothetical protein
VQEVRPRHKELWHNFCADMLNQLEEDNFLLERTVCSGVTFHLFSKANHHNLIIWCSENTHQVLQHMQDSTKVNVFSAAGQTQVYGPVFFADHTTNVSSTMTF